MSSRRTASTSGSRYAPYHASRTSHLPPSSRSSGSQSPTTATFSALAMPTTEGHRHGRDLSSRRATGTPAAASHPGRSSRPSGSSQSSSDAASSALGIPTIASDEDTVRDIALQMIEINFPGFQPRNEFDLFKLVTWKYQGARADLETWLDEQLAIEIQDTGSLEAVIQQAQPVLDMPASRITGLKPRPGNERNVFLRPIPNTDYSIRLYPGCALAREYCLDFVNTRTGLPVNSPFKFELWGIPNPSGGPSHGLGSARIYSLDSGFGVRQDEIPPGSEKFLLRDGQTCLFRRRGHKDIRFTVPIRRQPVAAASQADDNVDVWDLPTFI